MKFPVLGPGFVDNQHIDGVGVEGAFVREVASAQGSTPMDRGSQPHRSQEGSTPATSVQGSIPVDRGGLHT